MHRSQLGMEFLFTLFISTLSFGEEKKSIINFHDTVLFMKACIETYSGENTVDESLRVSKFIVDGLNLCHSSCYVESSFRYYDFVCCG